MSSRSSELYPAPVADFSAIHQRDLLALAPDDQERELLSFQTRLQNWAGRTAAMPAADGPTVSVEIPVFKGGWIIPAVESVLYQTSAAWTLSLRWDEGDELSRRALEAMHALRHPRILVHFGENLGIARTRRFLTEHSTGDYILPLDDDDMLAPEAIETFLAFTRERPWSGIVRARRDFIDGLGNRVQADPWFAFEPRHYQHGMVQDVANHCQPMLISRAAYARTAGWEGFEEFRFAGEDCDIFIKIEEVAPIELLDSILYYYRLSDRRTSLVITDTAAYEMWRRLADRSIARIGLPLTRTNDRPPFTYQRQPRTQPSRDAVDFVVFHVESADVENLTGSPADATIRSLGTCGVGDEAIHVVAPPLVGAPARNEGARRTRRPFICFVKAGTEIESDALTSLLHHMDARESDLVAPRVLAPDGAMACAAPAFTDQRTPTLRGEGAPHRDRYHSVVDAGWLPSTCLLVRREVMNAVGGFDQERAEMIADADFALKARRRDFTCTYVGAASVVDRGGASTGASSADNDWLRAKWNDDARLWQPLDFGSAGADYMTLYERGNALLREGNVETAIAAFRTVSAINSNFSWAYHSLGDALFQVERWAEAVDAYTDAIARKPDVPWSHLHRGNALNKLERWSDALDAYARAIELDPAIASAHGSSAHVLLRLGRWQDALSAFDKAATLDAGDFWLHYGRGDALAGLERWDEAVTAYDRAIALRSDVPWAFHHRGDSLAQLDRLEEAASAYRSAIALDPSMSASHTELGNVLFRLDQFREAVAEYDRAIAIDSNDFWAHYGRGDALSSPSLERWTEAIDAYERANAIRADEFWSYFNLGQAHTRLKHWDRAVTAFTQATRLNPSHARAHWKLGGVLTVFALP